VPVYASEIDEAGVRFLLSKGFATLQVNKVWRHVSRSTAILLSYVTNGYMQIFEHETELAA